MSFSALAVVEFPLAAAKIECADEIHVCENLKSTRIDVSSRVSFDTKMTPWSVSCTQAGWPPTLIQQALHVIHSPTD